MIIMKKGIPMAFQFSNGTQFMGIIKEVDSFGKLRIVLENDTVVSFEIKQIQMLY